AEDCVGRKACTREWYPVCGSDGVTYSNPCNFSAQQEQCDPNITIAHMGEC
uniref:Protease inhibitor 2 n=1 Tax=Cenchritis muricatus TaxID=197001 RepID=IPK2_CENMR|nr:RecName: Full=Protease inhibitor 2; AltName: Full=CmPI-II; AltName: Full=Protease inhibitor-II [Cenchritis muricatus]2N71_A Chain A, Protease inhibitor 2 [Cenchritis muricatus]